MERERHGLRHTRLYNIWDNMRQRCSNAKRADYKRYGERGITVCSEWDNSFIEFAMWAKSAGYTDNLTIDRKDNDGNYCPDNCHWVDKIAQMNNYSRNHMLTFNGKTQTLKQWCDELGLKSSTVRERLNKYGYTVEKALTMKPHQSKWK